MPVPPANGRRQKRRRTTRLAGGTVAVLPPEWAENQELAVELEDQRFPFLEDLREAVVGRKVSQG